MPYVESLGSFGQPRESILSSLPDALAKGMQIGSDNSKTKALLKIASLKEDTSKGNTATKALSSLEKDDYDNQVKLIIQSNKSASSQEVASMADNSRNAVASVTNPSAPGSNTNQQALNDANAKNLEAIKLKKQNDDQMFQNAQKLHEQHTMAYEYMSPDQQSLHKEKGYHDEITKVIAKGYGISTKDVPSLNPVNIYKKQISQTIATIPQQIKSGKALTPQTKQVYQLVKKYGVDDTALASHMVAKDPNVDHKDPQAVHDALNTKAQIIRAARQGSNSGNFADGTSNPSDEQLSQALQGN